MATEFDDSLHFATFKEAGPLRTGNAFDVRWSEITLAALRAAGFLDNMVDSLVPPPIDMLWLDKNLDPAVLKEWDPVGSNWEQVTSQTLFGRLPWRGPWEPSSVYRMGDIVEYGGSIWIAATFSQNQTPSENAYWDLLIQGATVANGAVSNVKLANMPTRTIKGRAAAGTGSPQDLTSDEARNLLDLGYTARTLRYFGAVGDGVANDDAAVAAAQATAKIVDGEGLIFAVSDKPGNFLNFRNAAFLVNGIVYPSADFVKFELSKITSTPFYAGWAQDKACTHEKKIIVPFQLAHGHTFDTTRIAWSISFDDGETFSAPEIIWDKHVNPSQYGYNVFSAGVKDNRFVMVVEERNVSDGSVNSLTLVDRVLDWSARKTNGVALTAGSAIATITHVGHGLMPGDKVSFSGVSGPDINGLTAELTVVSVLDADRFTVNKGSNSATTQANTGGAGWLLAASWYRNAWRQTAMPLFPNNLGNALTHVHSFANKPNSAELFLGFHNGSTGVREAGVIHVQNFYGTPTFTKRRFPATFETSAAEPCIRLVGSKLYATTRGQSAAANGSAFLTSVNDGQSWSGARFPGTLYYSPLPFEIIDGVAYIFGTERGENEWNNPAGEQRDTQNRPRSFMLAAPVSELEAGDFSHLQTTVMGYGIYEGEQTSSASGVGSTLKIDGDLWYFFGSEDWRVSTRYSYNLPTVDDEFIGHGYQPDLFAFRLRLRDRAGVNRFTLRAPDTRVLGQYRLGNGSVMLAPLSFERPFRSAIEAPRMTSGRASVGLSLRKWGTPVALASNTSGSVSLPPGYSRYYLDTGSAAASGECATINISGAEDGDVIVLSTWVSQRDITFLDNVGNLRLNGNFAITDTAARLILEYQAGNWFELTRSAN